MEQTIVLECQRAISRLEARGSYTRFDFGETTVGYYCDDTDSADWLGRYFAGYFVPSTTPSAHALVYSTCDPMLLALLHTCSSSSGLLSPKDSRERALTPQSLLIHRRSKGASIPEDVYYYLLQPGRKLLIVSSGTPQVRRARGVRIIRALMRMLWIERGWLPLHGACCTKNGQGICIVGNHFAGKTSTLINLLAKNGFHVVSTDQLLLYDAGSQLLACGLPCSEGIGLGTLLCHPPLLQWVETTSDSFFPHISLQSAYEMAATTGIEDLTRREVKARLLTSELAALFAVPIEVMTPLTLFLVPIFDLRLQTSSLAPLEEESQAVASLVSNYPSLARKGGEGFLQHFFATSDEILKERLTLLLTKFLPDLPVYELYQNHKTNTHSATLVAGLVSRLSNRAFQKSEGSKQ